MTFFSEGHRIFWLRWDPVGSPLRSADKPTHRRAQFSTNIKDGKPVRILEPNPAVAKVDDFPGNDQRYATPARTGIFSLGRCQHILRIPPILGAGASPEDSLTAILGKHHVSAQIVLL